MDTVKFTALAKAKIRDTMDLDIQVMYVWLEGCMEGLGLDDTKTFLVGSKILRELFD